ncbi:hypothetical protein CsSME_00035907 [Camellia sinensis var. sinensis]
MEANDVDDEEFGFSRNYFLAKELASSGKKSTHKLSDINLVDEQELREATAKIEPKHESEIASLLNNYKSLYSKWAFELRCGFGLLMYGFGSKKALIEDFASTELIECGVVVINGYLHSINLKQPFNSRSIDDLLSFLDGPQVEGDECFVCVVVHNIDGPGLRDSDSQQYLARIAACSHIRVVASIDNVNAPLLWDKKMVHTQFNWCWYHVPTFAPYKVEGIFYPLILAHGGTTQSVKTASIVLQSLTPNAQSVFKVLAEHQLAHPDEEGKDANQYIVYNLSRALPDHELVKTRRHSDGQDCLYIPLTTDALEKLVLDISQ